MHWHNQNHVYRLSDAQLDQPSMVTIGVFDGVHIGHQFLIRQLVQDAHASGRLAVVLTFFPHPDIVLRRLQGRYYLTTPEQRARQLLALGVDHVITQPFNEQTRQVRAADFVDELIRHLRMEVLRVGQDFALGYKREGNVVYLTQQGREKGFTVDAIDLVSVESLDGAVSSTLIRDALIIGDIPQAKRLLGRGYEVYGEVVHGKKRGRALGYPTANIAVWGEQVIPANGVYAGWAHLGDERFMAMTNVGISPQFMNEEVTVESYLLDFDRDIYGQTLAITFEKFLRPEARFNSLNELVDQIGRDVEEGRAHLAELDEQG